jgi:hypothetical protein
MAGTAGTAVSDMGVPPIVAAELFPGTLLPATPTRAPREELLMPGDSGQRFSYRLAARRCQGPPWEVPDPRLPSTLVVQLRHSVDK